MPSPFPGMNPYLEDPDVWPDFHSSFLTFAKAALVAQVRGRYLVRTDNKVYLQGPAPDDHSPLGRPDLSVHRASQPAPAAAATAAALEAPEEVDATDPAEDEYVAGHLEVLDIKRREVVAVLELLSPANKRPEPDRDFYRRKRALAFRSGAHFIELDLLRGGRRLALGGRRPECDYYALVSRAERRPRGSLWRLRLRDPLPTIPIPLKAGDADAALDLQAVLHRVYDESTFADEIYADPPKPPLSAEDAAWAAQFVPAKP